MKIWFLIYLDNRERETDRQRETKSETQSDRKRVNIYMDKEKYKRKRESIHAYCLFVRQKKTERDSFRRIYLLADNTYVHNTYIIKE